MNPLATAIVALAFGMQSEPVPTARPAPPRKDGGPALVRVGFLPYDFGRVTARDETFDVTGYLEMTWNDPRLARPGGEPGEAVEVDVRKIWTPRYYFENAVEQVKFQVDPAAEVDPAGNVTLWTIISGKFSSPLELHSFPFDRQVLQLRVGAFADESLVKFLVNEELIRIQDHAFLTDWSIHEPRAGLMSHTYVPGRETYSIFVAEFPISRRSAFYAWRVMAPLTLLVIVSWAIFWFEPVGLQPQISTCMASLIALVAFNFAIDFALPKVAYLTLIDKHALLGFSFVSLAVAVVVVVHRFVTGGRVPRALAIQKTCRWLFPLAYLTSLTLVYATSSVGTNPHPSPRQAVLSVHKGP